MTYLDVAGLPFQDQGNRCSHKDVVDENDHRVEKRLLVVQVSAQR